MTLVIGLSVGTGGLVSAIIASIIIVKYVVFKKTTFKVTPVSTGLSSVTSHPTQVDQSTAESEVNQYSRTCLSPIGEGVTNPVFLDDGQPIKSSVFQGRLPPITGHTVARI